MFSFRKFPCLSDLLENLGVFVFRKALLPHLPVRALPFDGLVGHHRFELLHAKGRHVAAGHVGVEFQLRGDEDWNQSSTDRVPHDGGNGSTLPDASLVGVDQRGPALDVANGQRGGVDLRSGE